MKMFIVLLLTAATMSLSFQHTTAQNRPPQDSDVRIANISDTDSEEFRKIRNIFRERNEGYDLQYHRNITTLSPAERTRALFVQEISGQTNHDIVGEVTVSGPSGTEQSEVTLGDIILLNENETFESNEEIGLLAFHIPEKPEQELPSFIRPDWDSNITDVPGGCATDIDAYRRILLTWKKDVGEYIYHALNAHRVRIYDSFSHYHPVDIGFDEFYLVQMVEPGAKIIVSERVDLITNPEEITESQTEGLVREYELQVGDLVYLPRGVMHRGVDGVLAQVITVPGFIPGSEIGVDHHLRRINEKLGLTGDRALPYSVEFSDEPVVR